MHRHTNEAYADEEGVAHAWDDVVPHDPDAEDPPGPDGEPYTYRDLVRDRAEARGMTVEEYLDGDPWEMEQIEAGL